MSGLRHVARNVSDLLRLQDFYVAALGFTPVARFEDAALARVLGVQSLRCVRLRLGAQILELSCCSPAGAPYPAKPLANARYFQHIAVVTDDIFAGAARALAAGAQPISQGGPQRLPAASGGAIAWKFRDPDLHPVELLQFPESSAAGTKLGYDHSAISVADTAASLRFYAPLGMPLAHTQLNTGEAQNRLDGLADATVEITALRGPGGPPGMELLCYRHAPPGAATLLRPQDIAADRLVFHAAPDHLAVSYDPDGHVVLHDGRLQI